MIQKKFQLLRSYPCFFLFMYYVISMYVNCNLSARDLRFLPPDDSQGVVCLANKVSLAGKGLVPPDNTFAFIWNVWGMNLWREYFCLVEFCLISHVMGDLKRCWQPLSFRSFQVNGKPFIMSNCNFSSLNIIFSVHSSRLFFQRMPLMKKEILTSHYRRCYLSPILPPHLLSQLEEQNWGEWWNSQESQCKRLGKSHNSTKPG